MSTRWVFCRFKVRTESLSSRSLCVKSNSVSKTGSTSSLDTGAPGFLFGAFVEVFVRDDVRIKIRRILRRKRLCVILTSSVNFLVSIQSSQL